MKDDVERARLAVAPARQPERRGGGPRSAPELATLEAQRAAELVEENFVSRTFFDSSAPSPGGGRARQQADERAQARRPQAELASPSWRSAPWSRRSTAWWFNVRLGGRVVGRSPCCASPRSTPLRVDVLAGGRFRQVNTATRARWCGAAQPQRAHAAVLRAWTGDRPRRAIPSACAWSWPSGGALPPGCACKVDLGLIGLGPALPPLTQARRPERAARPARTRHPAESTTAPAWPTPAATPVTLVTRATSTSPARVLRLKMAPIELPTSTALLAARR